MTCAGSREKLLAAVKTLVESHLNRVQLRSLPYVTSKAAPMKKFINKLDNGFRWGLLPKTFLVRNTLPMPHKDFIVSKSEALFVIGFSVLRKCSLYGIVNELRIGFWRFNVLPFVKCNVVKYQAPNSCVCCFFPKHYDLNFVGSCV